VKGMSEQRFFFEELFFLGMNIVWRDISKEEWVEANISGYSSDLPVWIINLFILSMHTLQMLSF
jgi:fido (protein-threonine AMPylation protein)